MESIVQALGGIVLRALPTFLLVILLHFYLKYMFFRPLDKVLKRRYELTEGARAAAEESLQRAAGKTAEYEAALRAARAEIYQGQEQSRRRMQEEQQAAVARARADAEASIQQARTDLAQDVANAKRTLGADSEALAEQIARALLAERAA